MEASSDLVWQVGLRFLKIHHLKSQTHFFEEVGLAVAAALSRGAGLLQQ